MRLLFLTLLLANLLGFAYIRYAESRAGVDAQIVLLQISPEKMKLVKPRDKDKGAAAHPSPPPLALACLEWGSFAAADAARAAAALARFGLADRLSQRETGDGGWWVYVPPLRTKAEADRKAIEIKSLGIDDTFVVPEDGPWRFAVALGTFRTEAAAKNYLEQLRQKGLRTAVAGPRGPTRSVFVIRDPGDALAAQIAALAADFPNAQLKATACAEALTNR